MKASLRWLSDLLGTPLSARDALERLPMLGVPVDAVEPLHHDLAQVVIAEVLEVARHPNADRLSLCKVNAGGPVLSVVCGAKNVTAGRRYPFAAVGTTLPGGLVLERRKIRGEYSEGMLCSARELGLGDEHEGILELETAAAPGTPFLDAVPVADTRLELDVTPNRPDLLSHLGLARDLGAVLGRAVRLPGFGDPAAPASRRAARAAGAAGETAGVRIAIEDAEGCPRFTAAVLRGVTIRPSPPWLRMRLEAAGVRAINNVVDATNYLLLEVGQPMHAYDLARLAGPALVARRARPGEAIVTLDGVRRALSPSVVVIADERDAQGVAGVMGGSTSEVSASTTDVLLECAYFDPRRTRAASRALGLSTEASQRFERGVDHGAQADHLARALDLLVLVAGGKVDGVPVDVYPSPLPAVTVFLRDRRVAHLLGVEIPRSEIERVLTALGCVVSPREDRLAVQVPTGRPDLTREVDLIEEIARIVGYDRFPDEMRPQRPGVVPDAPSEQVAARLRRSLTALGLHEAITVSLVPKDDEGQVELANPLSREEGFLRSALLPGLVRRAEHNWRMQQRDVRLFEVGNVFLRSPEPLPAEELRVAGVISGARRPPHWSEAAPPDVELFDVKALLEAAVAQARPGAAVAVGDDGGRLVAKDAGGRQVGWAGELPADRPAWGGRLFGFELEVEAVPAAPVRVKPLPAWPAVEQDVALVLPDGLAAAEVEASLKAGAGELLETLWPFDEYRGAPLLPGTRSVAWRLVFRAAGRTLRDAEVEAAVTAALREVERRHGVRRREA
ncbi:MAG TPA: phenylalanine--tRNA ligase subunit beta [Gemmatimonadales bacterium]|nr:phenylalanine--tRNA ligase subunit beta [Gemmatimonadales bacterium]